MNLARPRVDNLYRGLDFLAGLIRARLAGDETADLRLEIYEDGSQFGTLLEERTPTFGE